MAAAVERAGNRAEIIFVADFLPQIEDSLEQLIQWAERTDEHPTREWSGRALARLSKTLHDARKRVVLNRHFAQEEKRLAKHKNLLAGGTSTRRFVIETLEEACGQRDHLFMLDHLNLKPTATTLAQKARRFGIPSRDLGLVKLADFSVKSAPEWFAKVIWPRLKDRESEIMGDAQLVSSQTYRTKVAKNGRVYLSDFEAQFCDATMTLARRPPGTMRGVERPS